MLNSTEIRQTIDMLDTQNLDVRTITLSISLFDCISQSSKKTSLNIYNKICRHAQNLVKVGNQLSLELGCAIVNKRVAVTPISFIGAACGDYISLAQALDKAACEIGIDFIGGYSALVQKGMTAPERKFLESLPEAISQTKKVCSSVNVATSKAGINMDAVKIIGQKIKELAKLTQKADSVGCAKFVAFANSVEDNPFMAGAYTGVGEGDCTINVGVSGPGVIEHALKKLGKSADLMSVSETIKKTAFKITRLGALVARKASKRLNCNLGIVDLSLAPTPKVGDSVAKILEEIGLEHVGSCGTTAALALLNDAVKKGGVMACSNVGGLSGAFIPVSEDLGMIEAARSGKLTFDKLEAMTSVCSVGLDMAAVPGDTSAEIISAIIADECAIGVINNKTTAVRIIPVEGKGVGEEANFGGLLGTAPIMSINCGDPSVFINRGGQIPAPIHSNKN
ncbi:MAG: PFL family protein [Elusimicrobiota bacterium]|jgi:uncharacterized protein (UPF0210 family)|nr:PFL family protein [Elusimicrobiota bacterium]